MQLDHEKQQRENARQIKKMETEAAKLGQEINETRRISEEKKRASQQRLEQIREEMKTANEEDKARFLREEERSVWIVYFIQYCYSRNMPSTNQCQA